MAQESPEDTQPPLEGKAFIMMVIAPRCPLRRAARTQPTQFIHTSKQTQMDHPEGPSGWVDVPSQPRRNGETLAESRGGEILELLLSTPVQPGTDCGLAPKRKE